MAEIVLIPGFWLGAWAWEDVARALRTAGHRVHPVTLTGLAERAAEATPEVDVHTHTDDVVRVIEDGDLRDVVLVGHSGACVPVAGAADRIPDRIARLVYVDTGPLPAGMAVIDFNDPTTQEGWRERVAKEGDGWRLPPPPFDPATTPDDLAGLSGLSGLSIDHLTRLRGLATPQPFATVTGSLTHPATPADLPTTIITCTFTPDQVRTLAATGNPAFAPMARSDLRHLPTGHWPMLSRPADLAALLDEIAGTN
ncbi:alpha/beta hydrolase [Streptomyces mobaraensis NBRC 13819 = DSM 40847]|uniref:Esterase n=1 Tax=Streptomyces mobaraensis (strain ATCC 29032 / DSM 40847 / JCM 4168 / NBRC 13819 / NCIMB 11159 / IPCR 16-22) TaxID=1223523 RepID=M3BDN8_STRM1|nr:alpha/beta hydrolase [Streptomyces mobaraensis]EME97704.1 esterase [Streptomyces mobaraensis NBRC 13819 = DSM 40847]QTT73614.1 alpha/beta hydrolase [Streptomyces mobaraensis NBRC 13819 = DSM 40847]